MTDIFHFHEVSGEEDLGVDQVDSTLDCIRLHWKQTRAKESISSTGEVYGLITVHSLRGIVPDIKVYEYIDNLFNSNLS